jgi:hypothetical protein
VIVGLDTCFAQFFFVANAPLVSIISSTMSSLELILPPIDPPPPKRRKCANCKQVGHNRRTCTAAPAEPTVGAIANTPRNRNGVVATPSTAPYAVTPVADPSYINWDHALYVIFDLETTGRSRSKSEIVEIAAIILDQNGIHIEDATFHSLVRPKSPIPPFITNINHITNNMVSDAYRFDAVGSSFIRFMVQHADESETKRQAFQLVFL